MTWLKVKNIIIEIEEINLFKYTQKDLIGLHYEPLLPYLKDLQEGIVNSLLKQTKDEKNNARDISQGEQR